MADQPNFKSWYPVFGIRSYEEAIDYYVDWLGFNLDWEWREAPGKPAIVAISRDGLDIGLNEHTNAATGAWLSVGVADVQALADEWNGRRPGSVKVVSGVPYEGYVADAAPFAARQLDRHERLLGVGHGDCVALKAFGYLHFQDRTLPAWSRGGWSGKCRAKCQQKGSCAMR